MPTIAYYEKNKKEVVRRVKVQVKDEAQALACKNKRGFIRFCCGLYTIEDFIAICKKEGRSDWYV